MNKCKQEIINKTKEFVKKELDGETTGHDWWHSWRVWNMAKKISREEGGDLFIIEMAALLHDIDDWKLDISQNKNSQPIATNWMKKFNLDQSVVNEICDIIKITYFDINFEKNFLKSNIKSLEAKIVWDADKLDAVGAIGIARTFIYGGSVGRAMFDPMIKPSKFKSFEQYKKNKSTSINHFYEKILLLKDNMNTVTAKGWVIKRHKMVENYLKEFFKEWKGKI